MVTFLMTFTNP